MEAIKGTQFLKRIRAVGQLFIFIHVSEAYPWQVRTTTLHKKYNSGPSTLIFQIL